MADEVDSSTFADHHRLADALAARAVEGPIRMSNAKRTSPEGWRPSGLRSAPTRGQGTGPDVTREAVAVPIGARE